MAKSYFFTVPTAVAAILLVVFGSVVASGEQSLADLIAQEESGIELPGDLKNEPVSKAPGGQNLITSTIPQDSVLLIPNSNDPEAVFMFDPYDGDSLGVLISDTDRLATPQCAIKGPDGNIYVSDQIEDGVQVYDTSGAWLYTYCDRYDSLNGLGLDNVRGIDFRNDTLFVTCGGSRDLVAMFDAPHNRLPDFIPSGMDPYDIHFLDDGRALISNISGDNISLYNADGSFAQIVISTDFPEQTTYDDLAPGDFLTTAFSDRDIKDFDLDGTIHQITSLSDYGRGVHRLGNGYLLSAFNDGLFVFDPNSGTVVDTIMVDGGFHMIELFVLDSGSPPTGRCCYNNNVDCVDTTEAGCTGLGGTWDETLNCIDDPCPTGGCDYELGDVNGSDSYNGLDITYGVNFFKYGSPDPQCDPDCPPCQGWHYCGDVNASCNYNGLDITYGVNYFKYGSPAPQPCDDCPPINP